MKNFILNLIVCAAALPCFAGSFTDSRDDQTYETVKIGREIWMAENLNYKTSNSWCYENDKSKCREYGRLYSWDAAKKACPSGWHLPSKKEFENLQDTAGGERSAGKQLKSSGTWNGRDDGIDYFGFAGLPGGIYDAGYDKFFRIGGRAHFWSSTVFQGSHYYFLVLDSSSDFADLQKGPKENGLSVRCVKD